MRNEKLFRAMSLLFGSPPRIINEDEPSIINYPPPIISYLPVSTPIRSSSVEGGEQYAVNCPFCGDKRQRLYISHMWNAQLVVGSQIYTCSDRLVRCWNEECLRDSENRRWLCENLSKIMGQPALLDSADIKPAEDIIDVSELADQVAPPPHMADIDHPSVPQYIRDYWFSVRGFNLETFKKFRVKIAYLDYPIQRGAPLLQQPVTIIPVYQHDSYWWYQARLIPIVGIPANGYERNQLNDEYPKYYIPKGAKKRWTLYNMDNALKCDEVCIVEGPTDCWRIGDKSVAKFGRSLSIAQRGVLERYFKGKSLYLVPDQDDLLAWDEALKDLTLLRNTGQFKKVEIIKLPDGVDPGDLKGKEREVWEQLMGSVASQEGTSSTLSGIRSSL